MPPVRSPASLFCSCCAKKLSLLKMMKRLMLRSTCKLKNNIKMKNWKNEKQNSCLRFPIDSRSRNCTIALSKANILFSRLDDQDYRNVLEGEVGLFLPLESSVRKSLGCVR